MMLSRRGFVGVLAGLVAAPAVIRSIDLMPVRSWIETPEPISSSVRYRLFGVDGAGAPVEEYVTGDAFGNVICNATRYLTIHGIERLDGLIPVELHSYDRVVSPDRPLCLMNGDTLNLKFGPITC